MCFLMGALFHDVGMGVTAADFAQFREALGFPEPADDMAKAWRCGITTRSCRRCIWKSTGRCWTFPVPGTQGRSFRSAGDIGKRI